MKSVLKTAAFLLALSLLAGGIALRPIVQRGISTRVEPTALEAFLARRMRHLAVPRSARAARNPVPASDDVLKRARSHFADHCAYCHGNDGRGQTVIGQNLYPKAPNMSSPGTQQLSDGEIFYIIENGVRLTGMPGWGEVGNHDATESWELVHFIRHLPHMTQDELNEMESMNPKSRSEFEEEEQMRRFLAGEDVKASGSGRRDN